MMLRRTLSLSLAFSLVGGMAVVVPAVGQESRGRKYKAPPEVSHIEVLVVRGYNKKPIANAAVIFHPTKDGRSEGNLEVKTDPDGKAVIDVIPTGSTVTVQVLADGFATFAQDYEVTESSRSITVAMLRPRAQISAYQDNTGKASDRRPGVQEPPKPIVPVVPGTTTVPGTAPAAAKPSAPGTTTTPPASTTK